MTDTQWPRFIVFHQQKPGAPHEYSGSVHAPDAEMALMNARDVFVRRPACVSLWIVPAAAIFSRTSEQLAESPLALGGTPEPVKPAESYSIFEKETHKASIAYVGDVQAATPDAALKQALDTIANPNAMLWWVVAVQSLKRSTPDDIQILFGSAETKDYRDQAIFHTEAAMQKIKSRLQETESHES